MRVRILGALRTLVRLTVKLVVALLVGVYLLIARSFLFVLAIYICLYFASGTNVVRVTLCELVSGQIPGLITAANIQWGPLPWNVRIADGRVWGEHGQPLIRVPAADADIDIPQSTLGLTKLILTEGAPISFVIERAHAIDPWVHVTVDDDALVDIERAFSVPEPDDDDPPPIHDIRITHGQVDNLSGRIDVPLFSLDVEGIDAVGDFSYQGEKDPYFLIHRALARKVDLHLRPVHRPLHEMRRFSVPLRNLDVTRFDFTRDRFEALRAVGEVDGGEVSFRLAMLLKTREPEWRGSARFRLPGTSALLPDLVAGHMNGGLEGTISGYGTISEAFAVAQVRSPDLVVAGVPLRDVTMSVGIEPRIAPDGRLSHRILLQRGSAGLLGGRVSVAPVLFQHRWAEFDGEPPAYPTRNHLEATVLLEGVDPCRMLPHLGWLPGSCAFSGGLVVAGSIEEYSRLLVLDAQSTSLVADWSGMEGVPLDQRLRLEGGVHYIAGPPGSLPPHRDVFEPIERLVLDDLHLVSASDRLDFDGLIDLARGTITAQAEVKLPNLAGFLAPLGYRGFGGNVHLRGLRVGGTLRDPTIRGRAKVTHGVFVGYNVGAVEASLELSGGVLRTDDLAALTPGFGTISGAGQLRLHHGDITDLGGAHPFKAERVAVRDLKVHELLPDAGVVATVSIDARSISGDAVDPLRTLRGEGMVRATHVAFGGERAKRISASFDATAHKISASKIEIVLDTGDLLTGSFGINPRTLAFGGNLQTEGLPLSAINLFADNDIPVVGRVDARLSLGGTLHEPNVIGTVGLRGFSVEPIQLGDAALNVTTSPEGHLEISASRDFPQLELLEGTRVEMHEGRPTRIVVAARAHEADVYRILPPLRIEDTEVTASGFVEVYIDLEDDLEPWRVDLDAGPDEVEISLFDGQIVYRNLSPLFLVQRPTELLIQPVSMGRDLHDVLTLCGTIDDEQRLDLRVAGRANLELLGSFDDLFSLMRGAVAIGADPEVARGIGDDRCLPSDDDAVLRLQGPLDALEVSGRLDPRDVRLIPRDFGREFRFEEQAGFLIRPGGAPGRLEVILEQDPERRFRGRLDDGAFGVWGTIYLQDFYPDDATLKLVGRDLFYAQPGEFNLTFTPALSLTVVDFDQDDTRKLHLSGEALVTEGIFFLRLDGISAAFDSVSGPVSVGSALPLTERVPWLKDLTFDVAASASLFAVRPQLTMGKGEMETRFALRARGTLDEPEIFDRLEIIPGGTFEYDPIKREFEVVRGTLDFAGEMQNPYVDIEAETRIRYLTYIGDAENPDEREVIVSVRAFGPLDQIQVEFFSKTDPNFETADLQSLILTGRPRDDGGQVQDALGVSYDFGELLTNIIKAPLFEALNVRVGSDLTVSTDLRSRLGRAMELRTRVVQDPTETRVSAGFDFEIADSLTLEGRLQRTERSENPTQTYEARLKYRIPLD